MSARMRARSALRAVCECAAVMLMTSTNAAAMPLCVRREIAQCMPGRLLLRLFFRRPFAARREAADLHFDDKPFVVIRPDLAHHVVLRQRQATPLRQLLQRGFVILE